MTSKSKLIEQREVIRDYGFTGCQAIIEHPQYGRMLIEDAYGGENTLAGGCVRWRHGSAYQLLPDDTLAGLLDGDSDWAANALDGVTMQRDESRPYINISGQHIAAIAKSLDI